ncbi:MAG: heparan-alpha-glucosaminide N-acetyltransferase domain-containing protein [Acidimicrobiia bacterium]
MVERRRLRSVDAFRGLVLAFMVLTPATGGPEHFSLLRHAEWDGATPSDLLFPTFLVTSGISLSFLLRPPTTGAVRRRLVRRTVLLVLVGLAYNAYGTSGFDLSALRFTGVLQTIGISGAVAAIVVLALRRRGGEDRAGAIAAVAGLVTVAYWAAMEWLAPCAPVERCSPLFGIDRRVLGPAHTYAGGELGFDPEGIAVTVAASALVLVGYLGGLLVRRSALSVPRFVPPVLLLGGAAAGAGVLVEGSVAFNKRLLSSSFVLLAAGVALLAFAVVAVTLDLPFPVRQLERVRAVGSLPAIALGRNALVVFLLERLLLQTARFAHVGDQTAQDWALDWLPVGRPGVHLVYTGAVLGLILCVVVVLHLRRWYLAL